MLSINNTSNKLVIKTASKLYSDKEKYNMYWKMKYNVKLENDNESTVFSKIIETNNIFMLYFVLKNTTFFK